MYRSNRLSTLLLAGFLFLAAASSFSQAFPDRPVRIVVPISAGSGVDIIARALAEELTAAWGQPVSVENRPGGGGTTGTGEVAKAAPDGYTLLANTSGHAVNAVLHKSLPYDPRKDFVEVAALGSLQNVLVVRAASDTPSVSTLIEAAKRKPGELKYASAGIGTGVHLNAEKFKLAAGIDVVHLPANGGPEAIADTVSGRAAFFFAPMSIALPPLRDAKLMALAVSGSRRSPLLPAVPTVSEQGLPGFEFVLWNGLWAPSGTPPKIIAILARDVAKALKSSSVRTRFDPLGIELMDMTPAQFKRFVDDEIAQYTRIVDAAGIKAQ